MSTKTKYLTFGIVILIIGLLLVIKVFFTFNRLFEEEYSEYDEATNMYLDKDEEIYREREILFNNYLGKNIEDVKDEGLEELPSKEKGLLCFRNTYGNKVTMYYDKNGIIINIKLEFVEK